MKLYGIKVDISIRNEPSEVWLTLEGDSPDAEDGDWSASGAAAPFLNSQDGSWRFHLSELSQPPTRFIWLDDGPDIGYVNWLWRRVPNGVADLELPVDFPTITAVPANVYVRWEGDVQSAKWKLARRYF